jgi:hypothetical protein
LQKVVEMYARGSIARGGDTSGRNGKGKNACKWQECIQEAGMHWMHASGRNADRNASKWQEYMQANGSNAWTRYKYRQECMQVAGMHASGRSARSGIQVARMREQE